MLQRWMEEAKEFEIPELKAFVAQLFQDIEAVGSGDGDALQPGTDRG
jgi:hypothetical protein